MRIDGAVARVTGAKHGLGGADAGARVERGSSKADRRRVKRGPVTNAGITGDPATP